MQPNATFFDTENVTSLKEEENYRVKTQSLKMNAQEH